MQDAPRKVLAAIVHKGLVPFANESPAAHAAAVRALASLVGATAEYPTWAEDVETLVRSAVRREPVRVMQGA